ASVPHEETARLAPPRALRPPHRLRPPGCGPGHGARCRNRPANPAAHGPPPADDAGWGGTQDRWHVEADRAPREPTTAGAEEPTATRSPRDARPAGRIGSRVRDEVCDQLAALQPAAGSELAALHDSVRSVGRRGW